MKKVLSVVLAILMLAAFAVPAVASYVDTPAQAQKVSTSKTDILEGKLPIFTYYNAKSGAPSTGYTINDLEAKVLDPAGTYTKEIDKVTYTFSNATKIFMLTDGVYALARDAEDKETKYTIWDETHTGKTTIPEYINQAWTKNAAMSKFLAGSLDADDGNFVAGEGPQLSLNGVNTKYYYTFEWKDLNVDVDSFALFASSDTSFAGDAQYKWWWMDGAFDILVSTDGGNTYKVAYSSTKFAYDNATHTYTSAAKDDFAIVKDGSGKFEYEKLEADFSSKIEGVTNIVYACAFPRLNTGTDTKKDNFYPFYYGNRLSEIDVYGSAHKDVTTTGASGETTTDKKETDSTGDTSMIIALTVVGIVAFIGTTAVVMRKKEN